MSLSDTLLAGGCARHVEAVHGEQVQVLTGLDAGKFFVGVRENAPDAMMDALEIRPESRAKRVIRFRDGGPIPRLVPQDVIQTSDGKQWHATKYPQDGYLSSDFELVEIVPGVDAV